MKNQSDAIGGVGGMDFIDDKLSWTLFKVDFNMERAASTVWAEKKKRKRQKSISW